MLFLQEDPIRYLSRYLMPATIDEASDYLTKRLETATLYAFCDKHAPGSLRSRIPKEWMNDQEKLLPDQEAGKLWSEGESRCLDVISEIIPFSRDHVDMVAEEEGQRMEIIPLLNLDVDLYESYGIEHELGWRMLALLEHDFSGEQASFPSEVLAASKQACSCVHAVWSWTVFKVTCAAYEEPLSSLWIALQMLDHCTENVFLDTSNEMLYEEAAWTWEELEWLAEEIEEAEDFRRKANLLLAWILAEPKKRFRKVVDLWNLATWNMLMQE